MIVYGASGHGKVVIEILETLGKRVDFVVDDNPALSKLLGYEVRRNLGFYKEAVVAIGSCQARKKIVEALQVEKWVTAIHPTATISPRAEIGEGSVVMPNAVVNSCAVIGKHCIVNTGATVDHDCEIEDFVHVAPGAHISGGVSIGEGSWIGVGACVKQGVKIGKGCMIGAGAVVVNNIPDDITAVGVPAKNINQKDSSMKNLLYINNSGGVKFNFLMGLSNMYGGLSDVA